VHEGDRPHSLRQPLTSSFPSGHASAAFVAAALLSDRRPLPEKALWYGLAGVVASSRVHVKITTPPMSSPGRPSVSPWGDCEADLATRQRNLLARAAVG
jgi:hypothetical protein